MREFKVNENISLRLERKSTHIYIKGKKFDQCTRLVLNIPIAKIQNYDTIESIDEAIEIFKNTENTVPEEDIPPEVEFWAHCSNIQTWFENGYDTRLLHSNLAFPLLKKLTALGDPLAKRKFKEEVVQRFLSANYNVINYLLNNQFLESFTREELNTLFEDFNFKKIMNWEIEEIKEIYPWLRKFIEMKVDKIKTFFKEHITFIITNKKWDDFSFILKNSYLKTFNNQELESIFINFDYDSYLAHKYFKNSSVNFLLLYELNLMNLLGNKKSKEIFKNEVKKVILNGSNKDINLIFRNNYLQTFNHLEIKTLFEKFNFPRFLNSEQSNHILHILREFYKLDRILAKKYMKLEIEKRLSKAEPDELKNILDENYISYCFNQDEQIEILNMLNFNSLRRETVDKTFPILKKLKNLIPLEEVNNIYRKEVDHILRNIDLKGLEYLSKNGYSFTKDKLIQIFNSNSILKDDFIKLFENGDYKNLFGYFNRFNFISEENLEEICKNLRQNDNFSKNFQLALEKKDPPFSIPFKIIASIADLNVNSALFLFKQEAIKVFNNGPLKIISFLFRPKFAKLWDKDELKDIFNISNENIRTQVFTALKSDRSTPLALVVLKRLTDNGDEKAESILKDKLLLIITTGSDSMIEFLYKDGFMKYLD